MMRRVLGVWFYRIGNLVALGIVVLIVGKVVVAHTSDDTIMVPMGLFFALTAWAIGLAMKFVLVRKNA
jgi:hypothetical protein